MEITHEDCHTNGQTLTHEDGYTHEHTHGHTNAQFITWNKPKQIVNLETSLLHLQFQHKDALKLQLKLFL